MAEFITDWSPVIPWLVRIILGVALTAWLPWALIPAAQRRGADFLWACAVGASICLSIYASALVFYTWLGVRGVRTEPAPVAARAKELATGLLPVGLRWVWLVTFGVLHYGATAAVCLGVQDWLARYQ